MVGVVWGCSVDCRVRGVKTLLHCLTSYTQTPCVIRRSESLTSLLTYNLTQLYPWVNDNLYSIKPLAQQHPILTDTFNSTVLIQRHLWFEDTHWYPKLKDTPDSMVHLTRWHPQLNDTPNSMTPLTQCHPWLNDTPDSMTPPTQWHLWITDMLVIFYFVTKCANFLETRNNSVTYVKQGTHNLNRTSLWKLVGEECSLDIGQILLQASFFYWHAMKTTFCLTFFYLLTLYWLAKVNEDLDHVFTHNC
jgi:hypothetical protein